MLNFAEMNLASMTFDDITNDGRLWAVRYDGEADNVLFSLFDQWNDVQWLRDFFKANSADLESYFKITNINDAIERTIEDSNRLEAIIMDISPEANLDLIFRPLSNSRIAECLLARRRHGLRISSAVPHGFVFTPSNYPKERISSQEVL